jgi:hypothetical protein
LVLGEPGAGDPAGEYGNLLFQQVASGVPTTFATFNRTSGVESVCFGPTNGSNVASGLESIVLCGNNLTASGDFSACVAGTSSAASGDYAGTFVGYGNTASALYGACVGGHSNTASTGDDAICAGGSGNSSTGAQSSTVGSASSTASGLRSVVAGGYTLESSGTDSSCVGGNTNTASGDNSSCLGGTGTTASATGAMALGGCETVADHYAEVVNGGPKFSVAGDNQHSLLFLSNSTTDDTQTELFLDKASLQLTIPENTTCGFCAHILARRTDADGESAYYRIEGCIANDAGTTALVGSITKTVIAEDTAAWDVTAEADDTNDALVFKVTGEVDKVIYWNCSVSLNKITG